MKDDEDWESPLHNITRETMMDFFLFVGEISRIKSTGSSKEYIRQFSELYTSVTGRYVDRNDYKELYKVGPLAPLAYFKLANTLVVPQSGTSPALRMASPGHRQARRGREGGG